MTETELTKNRDSAIFCLLMSGRMHGRHLSYEQLYHNFFKENRKYDGSYLCKTIKNIKLNVKIINTKLDKIKNSKPAKAGSDVEVGDIIQIQFGNKSITIKVTEVRENVRKDDAINMYEIIE